MAEIRFYHLQRTPLEDALPGLLEKCLERGWRVVVTARSKERVSALSNRLWTYDKSSFLPHGTAEDGEAADQPIWLTEEDENPNGADVLFLVDGAETARVGDYRLVCDIFDGADGEAVAAARERWRRLKDSGHELAYWRQNACGGWEKAR